MRFCFGNIKSNHDYVIVEAKNKDHAIKIFKVSELFPEKCVDPKFILESNYENELNRYICKFKENPKIFIYVEIEDHEWKKVGHIFLKECIDVDYTTLMPRANLLEAPQVTSEKEEKNLPVVINAKAISNVSSKIKLREKHDEIAKRKAELESMVQEMNQAMQVLQNELKQKQKVIYIIETYLGIHEEVEQIADGDSAPANSLLTLYQQKLYMDEEVGIWDNDDGQGIDCKNIDEFDKWIIKHYKKFAYEPLSIVVWQIRRNRKEYGDVWSNVNMNALNKTTYFLIRNGEKIYRIWSDVGVGDRLFPEKDEYIRFLDEERRWGEERATEKLKDKHENYLYALIAIQGLIERTDVLGTQLRQNGVNLLSFRGNVDDNVRFIRDAETEFWIGDGKPRWEVFLSANRKTVCLGSRVCLSTEKFAFRLYGDHNDDWRCQPFRPGRTPRRDHCYIVEDFKSEKSKSYFPHGSTILIRYHSDDSVGWDPYTYEEIKRKRRVPWFLYSDEVINFDEITLEQADYYMKSRLDRVNYVSMLPTLYWICRVKRREQELEDEFIKMIIGKLNWDFNDENKNKVQEQITWWKLKNKWKRAITTKESTAMRMIIRRLRATL